MSHQAPEMNSSLLQPCRQGEGLSFCDGEDEEGSGQDGFSDSQKQILICKVKAGLPAPCGGCVMQCITEQVLGDLGVYGQFTGQIIGTNVAFPCN